MLSVRWRAAHARCAVVSRATVRQEQACQNLLSCLGTASSHQCCSVLLQELIYVESHLSSTSAKVRASALAGLDLAETAAAAAGSAVHQLQSLLIAESQRQCHVFLLAVLRRDHTAAAEERCIPGLQQWHRPVPGAYRWRLLGCHALHTLWVITCTWWHRFKLRLASTWLRQSLTMFKCALQTLVGLKIREVYEHITQKDLAPAVSR